MGNDSPLPSLPVTASVRDHGALGNGVADDTAAFVSAIAAMPSEGGVLYIPPGRWLPERLSPRFGYGEFNGWDFKTTPFNFDLYSPNL